MVICLGERKNMNPLDLRIGQGLDVHAFGNAEENTPSFVTLAGVKIPYHQVLLAHSDGDVVLHALSDALLGALALGDIGQHFPDTDAHFKGADSRVLLRHVYQIIQNHGFVLVNADITVACERPKLTPHSVAMRQNIADDLGVSMDRVSVKATTTEKLGFTGRQEGILAQAVVLLTRA
jgi:2-C-methyl-D-erythritol 2,4-cyclodiphosphate synthase